MKRIRLLVLLCGMLALTACALPSRMLCLKTPDQLSPGTIFASARAWVDPMRSAQSIARSQ